MQLPPVERKVNWPPSAAGAQSGGGAATAKAETSAIQEATVKVEAVNRPEPSVKLDISTTLKEIVELETAARARASARPAVQEDNDRALAAKSIAPVGGAAGVSVTAKLQTVGATEDSEKTGNGQTAPTSPEDAAKTAKLVDGGKQPGPNQPLSPETENSKDWTTTPKASEKKQENPPPEPMSKKLLDFLQSLWRAGGHAIDVTQQANQQLNPDKLAEGPLTYNDPSAVKKTSGV